MISSFIDGFTSVELWVGVGKGFAGGGALLVGVIVVSLAIHFVVRIADR